MPHWIPEAKWQDKDVFVIGGGSSLRGFDWDLLKPELTIGCNNAYQHGHEICNIVLFGDKNWWNIHHLDLEKFEGAVFTHAPQFQKDRTPWLWYIDRMPQGLHTNCLGWNMNTGAGAINLALLLGAKRVFLLGFDMQLSDGGQPNCHNQLIDKPNASLYLKFVKRFKFVARDLPIKFPGKEIINISDYENLDMFPRIDVYDFWAQRIEQRCVSKIGA